MAMQPESFEWVKQRAMRIGCCAAMQRDGPFHQVWERDCMRNKGQLIEAAKSLSSCCVHGCLSLPQPPAHQARASACLACWQRHSNDAASSKYHQCCPVVTAKQFGTVTQSDLSRQESERQAIQLLQRAVLRCKVS